MPVLPVISQPPNEAVPVFAASGFVVQASVPPGFVPTASVIGLVALVTTLPEASSTLTAGWVPKAAPLAPPLGWAVKAIWVAVPKVTPNVPLETVVKPFAAAVRV